MTHPRLTWHQFYQHGAITARLGKIEIGRVQPGPYKNRWHWRADFGSEGDSRTNAPSEQAAKDALTARVAEWLRDAGLEQVKETGG
jgi:hypothetical protein